MNDGISILSQLIVESVLNTFELNHWYRFQSTPECYTCNNAVYGQLSIRKSIKRTPIAVCVIYLFADHGAFTGCTN
ncbi:MAG: hypothetical protein HXS48_20400 [Theionarchaea archaeon]|nr:hypothetical protein [Theionarchaea archaeon]